MPHATLRLAGVLADGNARLTCVQMGRAMQLLLITSRWPHGDVTEFMDGEIHHLARIFDRVIVAPMRPKGPLAADLPGAVVVDRSLAEHLEHLRLAPRVRSRRLTAAVRVAIRSPDGLGAPRGVAAHDVANWRWLRTALLNRADATSVAGWASGRRVPDIAYTFWLGAQTVGLRRAWPNVPLVSRVHRTELYAEAHGWHSIPFQAAAVRSADLLATVSEDGRQYLARRYPDAASKMAVRRLGVRDLGAPARESAHGALRLLSASSITPVKRVDLILAVAQALARTGTEIEWTHLGDGMGREDLERAAVDGPASLTVRFMGHVPLERVHRELQAGAHDVFVNLSLSEGAPVSLMEAQCVGLPVVATAVGGTPEVVPAGLNELVGVEASMPTICEAVLRAVRRPPGESEERRRLWAARYDADVNYGSWVDELAQLVANGRERT